MTKKLSTIIENIEILQKSNVFGAAFTGPRSPKALKSKKEFLSKGLSNRTHCCQQAQCLLSFTAAVDPTRGSITGVNFWMGTGTVKAPGIIPTDRLDIRVSFGRAGPLEMGLKFLTPLGSNRKGISVIWIFTVGLIRTVQGTAIFI
jgi:hypothetical protein